MKTSSLKAPTLKTELEMLPVLQEITQCVGREISHASLKKANYIPSNEVVIEDFEQAIQKFREETCCYDHSEEVSLTQIPIGTIGFFWETETGGEPQEIECDDSDHDCERNGCGKVFHTAYTKQAGVNYLNNQNKWTKAAYAFFQERSTLAF